MSEAFNSFRLSEILSMLLHLVRSLPVSEMDSAEVQPRFFPPFRSLLITLESFQSRSIDGMYTTTSIFSDLTSFSRLPWSRPALLKTARM